MKLADLFEGEKKLIDTEDKLLDLLRDECSTMLAAYKQAKRYLYRGIKGEGAVVELPIRKDRKPAEMDPKKHAELELMFQQHDLTVTRTNGLFTTGQVEIARDWGEPYVIFVKNGWTCLVFDAKTEDYVYYDLSAIAGLSLRGDDSAANERFLRLKPREFKSAGALVNWIKKEPIEALFAGSSFIGIKLGSPTWRIVSQGLGL